MGERSEELTQIAELREEVRELKDEVKDLVEAWKAAGVLVKFVKLAATVVASIGAVYLVFRHGFTREL